MEGTWRFFVKDDDRLSLVDGWWTTILRLLLENERLLLDRWWMTIIRICVKHILTILSVDSFVFYSIIDYDYVFFVTLFLLYEICNTVKKQFVYK